jgi:hypothetical protein
LVELIGLLPHQENASAGGLKGSKDNTDEGGLPGPIGSDQRHKIPPGKGKGNIPEHLQALKAEGDILNKDKRIIADHSLSYRLTRPVARCFWETMGKGNDGIMEYWNNGILED